MKVININQIKDPLLNSFVKYLSLRDILNCRWINIFQSIVDNDKFWNDLIVRDFENIDNLIIAKTKQVGKELYKIHYQVNDVKKRGISFRLSKEKHEIQSVRSFEHLFSLDSYECTGDKSYYMGITYRRSDAFLYYLSNLRELTIENMKPFPISPKISNLLNLTSFHLSWCKNIIFPKSFWMLTNLTNLNLFCGKIGKIPKHITKLTNLTKLNLAHNELENINVLTKLTKLEELIIYCNKIKILPNNFTRLTDLKILNISMNIIEDITALHTLTNLTNLDLSHNKVESLLNISTLINLKYLDLSHNVIKSVSNIGSLTNLKSLSLDNNLIKIIPKTFGKLHKLTCLYLYQTLISNFDNLIPISDRCQIHK